MSISKASLTAISNVYINGLTNDNFKCLYQKASLTAISNVYIKSLMDGNFKCLYQRPHLPKFQILLPIMAASLTIINVCIKGVIYSNFKCLYQWPHLQYFQRSLHQRPLTHRNLKGSVYLDGLRPLLGVFYWDEWNGREGVSPRHSVHLGGEVLGADGLFNLLRQASLAVTDNLEATSLHIEADGLGERLQRERQITRLDGT